MNPTEYKMNGLYKFAKACALIPIFVGIVALIVGLFDQNEGGSNLGAIATAFLGLGLLPLGVGAAVDFDEAVEDDVAGEAATRLVLDVHVVLAVGFAVAQDEAGAVDA